MADLEKVDKLMEIINIERLGKEAGKLFAEQIMLDFKNYGFEEQLVVKNTLDKVFSKHEESYKGIIKSGYVRVYSNEEVDALINFYNTDLGKNILKKQKDIMKEYNQDLINYNKSLLLPDVISSISKALDDMAKKNKEDNDDKG